MSVPDSETYLFGTPHSIEAYRLLVIRGRLKLESKGLKFPPLPGYGSTHAYVKKTYGFKGTIASGKVVEQYEAMLREMGLINATDQ